ncbi:MAG: HEAT repeat domain-containing protein [Deltaproteobacteria bacterium]|nr:HEAT repeat domain-containing protein [Deltaproteobacteria bacterium]
MGARDNKARAGKLLESPDFDEAGRELSSWRPKDAANALVPHLCNPDSTIRLRAAAHLGQAVDRLAAEDMESAKDFFRRLIWHLNDESGGIGWGVPEAMAEILAANADLAGHFANILVSYISPGKNQLEHPDLFRQAVWAAARFARSRPGRARAAGAHAALALAAESPDPTVRGFAAWGLARATDPASRRVLQTLQSDPAPFTFPSTRGGRPATVEGVAAH